MRTDPKGLNATDHIYVPKVQVHDGKCAIHGVGDSGQEET